jgi:predicted nucleotidyltransferase
MRLSDSEVKYIVNISRGIFGEEVKVYLFGSRTDDTRKGGDIDLLIIPKQELEMKDLVVREIQFRTRLKMSIGDQKMDILIKTDKNKNSLIFRQAENRGVSLC